MSEALILQSVPDAYALKFVPETLAIEHSWLPFYCDQLAHCIHIATPRIPGEVAKSQVLERLGQAGCSDTTWQVQWQCVTKSSALTLAIQHAYADTYCFYELTERFSQQQDPLEIQLEPEHWPIVRWLDAMLNDAVHYRASDIHMRCDDDRVSIAYRIDGTIQDRAHLSVSVWRSLVARIKVLADLDITEQRRPQDGSFERIIRAQKQPVRVALMPDASLEKITLRLLKSAHSIPDLADIFSQVHQYQQVINALHDQQGLILVAGATGSGKTTTLYGCLIEWRSMGLNVISLEDPIEIPLSGVCQSAVNTQIGYEFADGLRAALRHDPDGLLVGEIRDETTCGLALRAAVTGHPVLASVHAKDASGVYQRLLNLGASALDLQESIRLIIVQRLVRTRCDCGGSSTQCDRCLGSGYFGRRVVAELFCPASGLEQVGGKDAKILCSSG